MNYAASLPQLGLSNKPISNRKEYIELTNDKNGYSVETEQYLDGGFNFSGLFNLKYFFVNNIFNNNNLHIYLS